LNRDRKRIWIEKDSDTEKGVGGGGWGGGRDCKYYVAAVIKSSSTRVGEEKWADIKRN